MTDPENKPTISKKFKSLLLFQGENIKFLESIKADADLIYTYKQLLVYLQKLSPHEVEQVLKCKPSGTALRGANKKSSEEIEPEKIRQMTVQQIEHEISNPNISRKYLESIATIKFGVTKGALSMLRTRDALINKIHTLLSNEYTHEVILRAASDNKNVK